MLHLFDAFRNLNPCSLCLRMFLSVLCGGMIGLEREIKRRPAGFRTHILITLGACVTTMTGQFLGIYMHYFTDLARLGAQVISGIGFIGAGAIVRTHGQQVRGLTSSAGLWASGIIGLCFGAGFYEGGVLAMLLILFAELVISGVDYWVRDHSPEITLYLEYQNGVRFLDGLNRELRNMAVRVTRLEISKESSKKGEKKSIAILSIQLRKHHKKEQVLGNIQRTEGMVLMEEL